MGVDFENGNPVSGFNTLGLEKPRQSPYTVSDLRVCKRAITVHDGGFMGVKIHCLFKGHPDVQGNNPFLTKSF